MTLSVVAKYPWGIMKSLPGGPGPEALLFVTDSLLTWKLPGVGYDYGEKLFPIGRNAAMAYAGSSYLASKAVPRLQRNFPPTSLVKAKTLTEEVQSEFAKARWEIALDLVALLGVYDPEVNRLILYGLDSCSSPPFYPHELSGVHAIGSSKHVGELYKKKLDEFVWGGGRVVSDDPFEWLNFMAIVLRKTIELEIASDIGGLVQTAIVDYKGFRWVSQAKWSPGKGTIEFTQRKNGGWQIVDKSGRVILRTMGINPWGIFKLAE